MYKFEVKEWAGKKVKEWDGWSNMRQHPEGSDRFSATPSIWSTLSGRPKAYSPEKSLLFTPIILDNFNKEYSFKVSIFLVVHKILLVRGTLSANFARLFKSFELGNILQVVLPDV